MSTSAIETSFSEVERERYEMKARLQTTRHEAWIVELATVVERCNYDQYGSVIAARTGCAHYGRVMAERWRLSQTPVY